MALQQGTIDTYIAGFPAAVRKGNLGSAQRRMEKLVLSVQSAKAASPALMDP